ncbi:uncharacterized protein G2W53_002918 [Senna tora]|uniref:Uncharacterized protein n=1 Tax=Senna tora TaxID=362788 RepID=A0A834X9M1_9FABA|nr:uncharacterized protein G2W53_002918 [Senna tora]
MAHDANGVAKRKWQHRNHYIAPLSMAQGNGYDLLCHLKQFQPQEHLASHLQQESQLSEAKRPNNNTPICGISQNRSSNSQLAHNFQNGNSQHPIEELGNNHRS